MTDVDEMIAFTRAQILADRAAAAKATPGPWSYDPGKMWLDGEAFESFDRSKGEEYIAHGGPSPFTGCVAATGPAGHPQGMADAAHIARNGDPRDVIADCDAKTALLEEYERAAEYYNDPENRHIPAGEAHGLLTAVRLLAQGYRHREGYKEDLVTVTCLIGDQDTDASNRPKSALTSTNHEIIEPWFEDAPEGADTP